jgi:hypothetical protein
VKSFGKLAQVDHSHLFLLLTITPTPYDNANYEHIYMTVNILSWYFAVIHTTLALLPPGQYPLAYNKTHKTRFHLKMFSYADAQVVLLAHYGNRQVNNNLAQRLIQVKFEYLTKVI